SLYLGLPTRPNKIAKFCSGKFEAFFANVRNVHGKSLLASLGARKAKEFCFQSPFDVPFHIFDPRLPTRPQVDTQGRSKRASLMFTCTLHRKTVIQQPGCTRHTRS